MVDKVTKKLERIPIRITVTVKFTDDDLKPDFQIERGVTVDGWAANCESGYEEFEFDSATIEVARVWGILNSCPLGWVWASCADSPDPLLGTHRHLQNGVTRKWQPLRPPTPRRRRSVYGSARNVPFLESGSQDGCPISFR